MMNPRIAKLESLLARIKTNASAPRAAAHVEAAPAMPVAEPPTAEVAQAPEPSTQVSARHAPVAEREIEVPLESRARLVAAPQSEPPEEIEAEDVIELDDRNVVRDLTMNPPSSGPNSSDMTRSALDVAAARASAAEQHQPEPPKVEEQEEQEEAPPPSSRRPIAEPAETPQEAEIQVTRARTPPPQTPPPESGKQVAAEALSFDDDFTGVREAQVPRTQEKAPEAPIGDATRPPPGPLPDMRAPRIESALEEPARVVADVARPTRPVAQVPVAEMIGTVKPASPKTFGELLDLTLSL